MGLANRSEFLKKNKNPYRKCHSENRSFRGSGFFFPFYGSDTSAIDVKKKNSFSKKQSLSN